MTGIIDAKTPAGSQVVRSERLEATLVGTQHLELPSLILGTILIPICAFYISHQEHKVALIVISSILVVAGGMRLATTLLYRKLGSSTTYPKTECWKVATISCVMAYAVALGAFGYAAITQTDDFRLHLFALTLVVGYSAGTVGRNAGLQAGTPIQAAVTVLAAAFALAQRDDYIYRILAAVGFLYFFMLRSTSKSIHDQILSLFQSNEAKEYLFQEVTEKSERFDAALSNMPHGVAMVDADCRVVVANKKLCELFGLPAIADRVPIGSVFERSARNEILPPESIFELNRKVHDSANNGIQTEIEIDMVNSQTLEITFQPMSRGGSVVIVTDVTHKKALDRITHLAHHDTLTGLPNRMYFERRFASMLDAAKQGHDRIAVMALDLDRFKAVNDTLGHQVGDELLKAVAKRIQGRLRADDFVSRIGGDEFMLIHANAIGDSAAKLARRLIKAVSAPYDIDGNEIVIGLTMGIAHFPGDGADAAELLRNADIALYQAKNAGRGVFQLFEPQMAGEAAMRKAV